MNVLEKYIEETGHYKPLSDSEEQALAQRVQEGDNNAAGKLMESNLRYVIKIAHQYASDPQTVLDLIGEGNIGLLKAAYKYKPTTGKRFAVFAAPYIRKAMENSLQPEQRSLDQSIPVGSKTQYTLLNILRDPSLTAPDNSILTTEAITILRELLPQLPARTQKVMSLLYGLVPEGPMTMAEAADVMNLKRERVRQIRNQALRQLKKLSRDNQIAES